MFSMCRETNLEVALRGQNHGLATLQGKLLFQLVADPRCLDKPCMDEDDFQEYEFRSFASISLAKAVSCLTLP